VKIEDGATTPDVGFEQSCTCRWYKRCPACLSPLFDPKAPERRTILNEKIFYRARFSLLKRRSDCLQSGCGLQNVALQS
jgi:hypothetical protein